MKEQKYTITYEISMEVRAAVQRRTYRVILRGRFGDLSEEQRERLLGEAERHTVLDAAFTDAGTLSYEPGLHGWVGRVQVATDEADPADADALAGLVARDRITEILAGYGLGLGDPQVSASCLEDLKINRKGGAGSGR